MTNKELQRLLSEYPDDMQIKLYIDDKKIIDFKRDNMVIHSDTAHIDSSVDEDEWNTADGKLCLGDGVKYLLLNPPIL